MFESDHRDIAPASELEGEYYTTVVSYKGESMILDPRYMEVNKPHPFRMHLSGIDEVLFVVKRESGELEFYFL